jgi:hypothetical protein
MLYGGAYRAVVELSVDKTPEDLHYFKCRSGITHPPMGYSYTLLVCTRSLPSTSPKLILWRLTASCCLFV